LPLVLLPNGRGERTVNEAERRLLEAISMVVQSSLDSRGDISLMSLAADSNARGAFEEWDAPSADVIACVIETHSLNLNIGRSLHAVIVSDGSRRASNVLIAEEIPFLFPSLATQISLLKGRNAPLKGKKS
jgi:hypothetical protein